jgi:hypothetical protein
MDIGSLFLILGLLVLVGLFVTRPLFEGGAIPVSAEEHERSALLAERDRVINALQELDFDYSLGKIPKEDYPAQRAALLQKGAEVLRKLDDYQVEGSAAGAEDRIETAIAARRADSLPVATTVPANGGRRVPSAVNGGQDDELEAIIAARRRQRNEKAGGFCPQCGGPVLKSDQFCPKCGEKLA